MDEPAPTGAELPSIEADLSPVPSRPVQPNPQPQEAPDGVQRQGQAQEVAPQPAPEPSAPAADPEIPAAPEAVPPKRPNAAAVRKMTRKQAVALAAQEGVAGPNAGTADPWAGYTAKDVQDRILKARKAAAAPPLANARPAGEEQPALTQESQEAQTQKPPELMTPEENIERAANGVLEGGFNFIRDTILKKGPANILAIYDPNDPDYRRHIEEAEQIRNGKLYRDNLVNWHISHIEDALDAKKPVSALAVDNYISEFRNLKLPAGYVRSGDQYVFKGPQQPRGSAPRAEPAAETPKPPPSAQAVRGDEAGESRPAPPSPIVNGGASSPKNTVFYKFPSKKAAQAWANRTGVSGTLQQAEKVFGEAPMFYLEVDAEAAKDKEAPGGWYLDVNDKPVWLTQDSKEIGFGPRGPYSWEYVRPETGESERDTLKSQMASENAEYVRTAQTHPFAKTLPKPSPAATEGATAPQQEPSDAQAARGPEAGAPLRKGQTVRYKGEDYFVSGMPRLLKKQGIVEITRKGGSEPKAVKIDKLEVWGDGSAVHGSRFTVEQPKEKETGNESGQSDSAREGMAEAVPQGEGRGQDVSQPRNLPGVPQGAAAQAPAAGAGGVAAEKSAAEPVAEQTLTETVVTVPMSPQAEKAITMKEQKAFLLAEIDKAIEAAPRSTQEEQDFPRTVRIEVPNDGVFTIPNGRKELEYAKKVMRARFPTSVPRYVAPGATMGTEDLGRDADQALDLYKDAATAARKIREQIAIQSGNQAIDEKQKARMESLADELESRAQKTSKPVDQRTAAQKSVDAQIEAGTYPSAFSPAIRAQQEREAQALAAMKRHPLYAELRQAIVYARGVGWTTPAMERGDLLNVEISGRGAPAIRRMQDQIAKDFGLKRSAEADRFNKVRPGYMKAFDLRRFYGDYAKGYEPVAQEEPVEQQEEPPAPRPATVEDLRAEAKAAGLSPIGTKDDLEKRLAEARKPAETATDADLLAEYKGPDTVKNGSRKAGFTDRVDETQTARRLGLVITDAGQFKVYSRSKADGAELAAFLRENGYGATRDQKMELSRLAGYSEAQVEAFGRMLDKKDKSNRSTAPKPGELQDFGQKLGGARKDQPPSLSKELTADAIATEPFSQIWPKEEADSIEDAGQAAVVTAFRDAVPSKPRKGYKLERWVKQVKTLRDNLNSLRENNVPPAEVISRLQAHELDLLKNIGNRLAVLTRIDRAQWGRIGEVRDYPNAYYYDKAGKKIPSPHAEAEVDGRTLRADSLDALVEAVRERLAGAAPAETMKFEFRRITKTGDVFINKMGDPLRRPLKTFPDFETADKFRKENYDLLVQAWEDVKGSQNVKETDVRLAENRPRTGKDHRQGQPATPEMFTEAFGFRGVEFGNWVSQGRNIRERQGMLDAAYDALMDLADIAGVPARAISLDGTLGLGLGSRGHGWASAHFEPDTLVINLTKTRGAGTLAHEWFHALDNYFQRKRSAAGRAREDIYITYQPETYYADTKSGARLPAKRFNELLAKGRLNKASDWTRIEGVRPEVEEKFAALVRALDASPMAERSSLIDKGQSGYWSRIIERAARAFENYVIAKMQQKGYDNDYLANVATIEKFARDPGRYPYLLADELKPVEQAFDDLFGTIQTRETDRGVEMFAAASNRTNQGDENVLRVSGRQYSGDVYAERGSIPENGRMGRRLGPPNSENVGRIPEGAKEGAGPYGIGVGNPQGLSGTPDSALIFRKALAGRPADSRMEATDGNDEIARRSGVAAGESGRQRGGGVLPDGSGRQAAAERARNLPGEDPGGMDAGRILAKARRRAWGRQAELDDSPAAAATLAEIRARLEPLGIRVAKVKQGSIGTNGAYLGGGDVLIATRNSPVAMNEAADHEAVHFLDRAGDAATRTLKKKINRGSTAWKGLREWLRVNYRANLMESGLSEQAARKWLENNLTPADVDAELIAELARPTTGPAIDLWQAFGALRKPAEQDWQRVRDQLYPPTPAAAQAPARTRPAGPTGGQFAAAAQAARDREYLAAVQRGDMETAQRIVDEAAKRAAIDLPSAYAGVPNSLMGFRNSGQNKNYSESNFKTEIVVVITNQNETFVDGIKGLNVPHAMERARRNWAGDSVKFAGVGTPDPIVRDDSGRIIPPSERFNPARADIRFAARPAAPGTEYDGAKVEKYKNREGGESWKIVWPNGGTIQSGFASEAGAQYMLVERMAKVGKAWAAVYEDSGLDSAAVVRDRAEMIEALSAKKVDVSKGIATIKKYAKALGLAEYEFHKVQQRFKDTFTAIRDGETENERVPKAIRLADDMLTDSVKFRNEHKRAVDGLQKVVRQINTYGAASFGEPRRENLEKLLGSFTFKRLRDNEAVRDAIASLRADEKAGLTEDEIRELDRLVAMNVADMDTDEIDYMAWMLSRTLDEQKAARDAKHAARRSRAEAESERIVRMVQTRKNVDFDALDKETSGGFKAWYASGLLPSRTVAYILDGGAERGPIAKRFIWSFWEGRKQEYRVMREVEEALAAKLGAIDPATMQRPTEYRQIPKDKLGRTTRYNLAAGKTVELYDGERISIYLSTLNERNVRHATHRKGGFVLEDSPSAKPIRFSEDDLAAIAADVQADPELMKIAEAFKPVFNDLLKRHLNATSEKMDAETIADEDNYLPMVSASMHRQMQSLDSGTTGPGDIQNVSSFAIGSQGSLKRRIPNARNPLMLYDVFTLARRATRVAGLYSGFAEAIDMVKRVRAPVTDEKGVEVGTVEGAIRKGYGSQYWDSIMDLARSYEENRRPSPTEQKALSWLNLWTRGALAWNIPVKLAQAVSYYQAAPFMPAKYWWKGLFSNPASWEEMGRKNDVLYARGKGKIDIATGEAYQGSADKFGQRGMKGILEWDRKAIGRIWNAVQEWERDLDPTATDEEIEIRTGNRVADEIIWLSQPSFEPETRSRMQREHNVAVRSIMRFSSQRTKNFDMLFRAFYDFKIGKTDKGELLRKLGILLAAQIAYAALKTAVETALKRREPDEAGDQFLRTLISAIASLGGRGTELLVDMANSAMTHGRYKMQDPFFQHISDAGQAIYDVGNGTWRMATGEDGGEKALKRGANKAFRVVGVGSGTGIHNAAEPGAALLKYIGVIGDDDEASPKAKYPMPGPREWRSGLTR